MPWSNIGRRPKLATPSYAPAVDAHAHGVDAVPQAAVGIEPQVGGGIAELASALVAVHDLAADEPGIAEQIVRLADVALGERRTNGPRAHGAPVVLERGHDVDGEAAPGAGRDQIVGRALGG